jgi:hypothetical protein
MRIPVPVAVRAYPSARWRSRAGLRATRQRVSRGFARLEEGRRYHVEC